MAQAMSPRSVSSPCVPAPAPAQRIPSQSCCAQFVPARVPVPSVVREARAGPGGGQPGGDRAVMSLCMSPTAEPRQLPRCPDPRRCNTGAVPKRRAGAAPQAPGGGLGGDPTVPGSILGCPRRSPRCQRRPSPGFAPWDSPPFSRAPGSGDPRPRSFPRPVTACGQRGPCQSCLDPPTLLLHPPGPLPSPRGGTRGDSAGWVAVGRGACDSFARSRTKELTLWGLVGPHSPPRPSQR